MTHVLHPLSKTERPVCILTVYVSPIPIRCILFNYRLTQEGRTRESAARGNWPTVQTNGFAFSNEMFMFIRIMVVITKLDKTKYHSTEKNRRKPVMQMCTILTHRPIDTSKPHRLEIVSFCVRTRKSKQTLPLHTTFLTSSILKTIKPLSYLDPGLWKLLNLLMLVRLSWQYGVSNTNSLEKLVLSHSMVQVLFSEYFHWVFLEYFHTPRKTLPHYGNWIFQHFSTMFSQYFRPMEQVQFSSTFSIRFYNPDCWRWRILHTKSVI